MKAVHPCGLRHDSQALCLASLGCNNKIAHGRVRESRIHSDRDESVAFWRALHNDLMTDRLDDIIARSLPDVATAEAEFRRPVPLDGDKLWALARARAKTKPASFL